MEFLHIAGEAVIAAHSWHTGERRSRVLGEVHFDASVNCIGRTKGIVDRRQDGVLGLIAKMIHEANRARFLTAQVKTAV